MALKAVARGDSGGGGTGTVTEIDTGRGLAGGPVTTSGTIYTQPTVVVMADATSFTPTPDTADINTQVNTQAAGTLTANAPSGSPLNGQKIIVRLTCTNAQNFSWNAIYRGSPELPLPAGTSGGGLTDYLGFIYNGLAIRWDLLAKVFGI